jgi:hypothetical protein
MKAETAFHPQESLIVADIKIGLSTVISDKDLAMGVWIHRAGINIYIKDLS